MLEDSVPGSAYWSWSTLSVSVLPGSPFIPADGFTCGNCIMFVYNKVAKLQDCPNFRIWIVSWNLWC